MAHVERERLLAGVAAGEVARRVQPARAWPDRRRDAQVVRPRLRLDLDDLGPVQRQRLGDQGAGPDPAEVEDPQSGEDLALAAHAVFPARFRAPGEALPSLVARSSLLSPGTAAPFRSLM